MTLTFIICTFDDEFTTNVTSKKHKVKRIVEIIDADIAENLSVRDVLVFSSLLKCSIFVTMGNGDCDAKIERRRLGLSFSCVFISLLRRRIL